MSEESVDDSLSSRGLENLQVWRKSMTFAVRLCREYLPSLPGEERYALSDQLRRAVQSIPANIAEGYGRYHYQDNIRFCYIARGSLEEVRSHLRYAIEMGYGPKDRIDDLFEKLEEIRRMSNGYIAYLKSSKPGATIIPQEFREEPSGYHVLEPSTTPWWDIDETAA